MKTTERGYPIGTDRLHYYKKKEVESANTSPFIGGRKQLIIYGLSNPQRVLHFIKLKWSVVPFFSAGC